MYLIQNDGLNFSDAKKQARNEVLDIFHFTLPEDVTSESLDITEDAMLLAVSIIVQGNLSTGDVSLLLANISADIRTTGKLNNPLLGSQLMNNVAFLDLNQIKSNMEKRYAELGVAIEVDVDELSKYIQTFRENSGFEQTLFITYPEMGLFGPNILYDGFVEGPLSSGRVGVIWYSLTANVPKGGSLKVVVRADDERGLFSCRSYPFCNTWLTEWQPRCPNCDWEVEGVWWGSAATGSAENWFSSRIEGAKDPQSFAFTVRESGTIANMQILINNDFIVEFYENGATEPTRTKKVRVIRN
jgi:hypothetical protein